MLYVPGKNIYFYVFNMVLETFTTMLLTNGFTYSFKMAMRYLLNI